MWHLYFYLEKLSKKNSGIFFQRKKDKSERVLFSMWMTPGVVPKKWTLWETGSQNVEIK